MENFHLLVIIIGIPTIILLLLYNVVLLGRVVLLLKYSKESGNNENSI
jgi:hypothetical protein